MIVLTRFVFGQVRELLTRQVFHVVENDFTDRTRSVEVLRLPAKATAD